MTGDRCGDHVHPAADRSCRSIRRWRIEACNKIIHAKNIVLDSNGAISADDRFIKPTIFCYDDFMQEKSWKAVINLLPFVEHCDMLMYQFG
jgi:hypothetical protein